jgi:urocanate hydratase
MTEFEKKYMKRLLPFYGFLKANMEHQVNAYVNNPRRFFLMNHTFENVKKMFSGQDITQEEWDTMPEWIQNGLVIPLSRDDSGNVRLMQGFGEPTQVYNQVLNVNSPREFLNGLMSAVNPLIKLPIEILSDRSFFAGDKISNQVRGTSYSSMPPVLRDLLNYKSNGTITDKYGNTVTSPVVNPQKRYALENTPFVSPYIIQAKNLADGLKKDPLKLLNLSGILGGKVRTRNIFQDKKVQDKKTLVDAQDIIEQLGIR